MTPSTLFWFGIVLCGIGAVGGLVSVFVLLRYKKRLAKQLEADYGERRHKIWNTQIQK